jgi:hypothetical protein
MSSPANDSKQEMTDLGVLETEQTEFINGLPTYGPLTQSQINQVLAQVPPLEGTFHTWTEITGSPLSFSISNGLTSMFKCIIDETNKVAYFWCGANSGQLLYFFVISIGTTPSILAGGTQTYSSTSYQVPQVLSGSIFGKYIAFIAYANISGPSEQAVIVESNGNLVNLLGAYAGTTIGVAMSSTGKYILIFTNYNGNGYIHILKGS